MPPVSGGGATVMESMIASNNEGKKRGSIKHDHVMAGLNNGALMSNYSNVTTTVGALDSTNIGFRSSSFSSASITPSISIIPPHEQRSHSNRERAVLAMMARGGGAGGANASRDDSDPNASSYDDDYDDGMQFSPSHRHNRNHHTPHLA